MACNCEYCIKCELCGHRADEHIAGNGACFKCKCGRFTNQAATAWDKLIDRSNFLSFEEFIDQWTSKESNK